MTNIGFRKNYGFTLVELSIVLVILGVLTGGVLAGSELIRASELRSITSQHSTFKTAVHTFNDKYLALPGDMKNATKFWGVAGGNGADFACAQVASPDETTCDGNGNGEVGLHELPSGITLVEARTYQTETTRFWQHMANAGIIRGRFTGSANYPGAIYFLPVANEQNAPTSKLDGLHWMVQYHEADMSGSTALFQDKNKGIYFYLVQKDALSGYVLVPDLGNFLTPAEAWSIDKKIDDGSPNKGKMLSNKTNCSTTSGMAATADINAEYDVARDERVCGVKMY